MRTMRVLRLLVDYVDSLADPILSPLGVLRNRSTGVGLAYAIITVVLTSTAKQCVIVGSVFYKTIKWAITWFPQYTFIFGYADYVASWIVLIGVLLELGIYLVLAVAMHYTLRLLGGRTLLLKTAVAVGYTWVADTIVVIGGVIALSLDIPSTVTTLIASYVIALIVKALLLVRNLSIIHEVKWTTTLLAVVLVAVLLLIMGLAVIMV